MILWAMLLPAMPELPPEELFRERYAATFRPANCVAAAGCGEQRLPILEARRQGVVCLGETVPSLRIARGAATGWAVPVTFVVRELDGQGWVKWGSEGRVAGLVATADDSLQELCIEPIHAIAGHSLQVRLEVPGIALDSAAAKRLGGKWLGSGSGDGGPPLPATAGGGPFFQSRNLVDWLFGTSSNELVRLTVRSRQPAVPLLIRGKHVGVTDKTLLVARSILNQIMVGHGARAVKLSRCRQIANTRNLVVECP